MVVIDRGDLESRFMNGGGYHPVGLVVWHFHLVITLFLDSSFSSCSVTSRRALDRCLAGYRRAVMALQGLIIWLRVVSLWRSAGMGVEDI